MEITLLGQNVNSYGVGFGDRAAFAKLLRACGDIEGLERVRFTSPHPAAFTDDVIAAMAETPNVMPSLHMPLQSGSDRVLRAMRRSYRSDKFLGILERVRAAMPDAAITTDIIVGFPGETDEDFEETLRVVEESRFASAYTFQYSPRPGTPAFDLPTLPHEVVSERYVRLHQLQERMGLAENQRQVGRTVEVMVLDFAVARTAPLIGSLAARPTTGSCTSACPTPSLAKRRRRRALGTWSRSTSRTPHRTTSSQIARWPAARTRCAARARATCGTRCRPGSTAHGGGGCGDSCGTGGSATPGVVGLGIPALRPVSL